MKNVIKESCIDCYLCKGERYFDGDVVDFFDSRPYQYSNRCMMCERKYIDDFLELYPNTITAYEHIPLTKYERERTIYHQLTRGLTTADAEELGIKQPEREE